ncbi:hypothetical protein RsTz2092_12190 [Deferribacterales bacterium RsTz2092]|nr:hypothetical protein AGMMS49941_11060 [Deferribacterales bacterium]
MHEVGIARSILDSVASAARKNGADAVKSVKLQVGSLSGVEASSLQFALDAVKAGTIATGAEFIIERVPAVGVCGECGKTSTPDTFFAVCEHCGNLSLDITAGRELKIDYIEV